MRRARYRVAQFLAHLRRAPLRPAEQAQVRQVLPAPLAALFWQMTPGEQAHSLRVLRAVSASGSAHAARPELLQAALLHDVGKALAPLSIWDRGLVVLAGPWLRVNGTFANAQPRGWRRPFLTAARHPEWGAALCGAAGAAPLTVQLIRRHQAPPGLPSAPEDEMLLVLQAADDEH